MLPSNELREWAVLTLRVNVEFVAISAAGASVPSRFVRISVVGHQLHYSKIEVCFGAQVKHIQLAPENIFLS